MICLNMEAIIRIYYFIGSLVCHQIPGRTLSIDEISLPLCARDTGIYSGIFVVLVYCIVRGKIKADRVPSTGVSVVLTLLMIPMMLDAVTSYVSIRQTDNIIRLVTGFFFGMSIAVFLIPAANFKVYGVNKLKVIDGWFDLLILSGINILACIVILRSGLPIWIVSTASIAGLIFVVGRIIYTLIKLLNIGEPKRRVIYASALTVIAFGLLYIVKCFILVLINKIKF